jgi:N6-adenosine-specific RNA methylase IME4
VIYTTVVADPPWPYRQSGGPRSATSHRPNAKTHVASGAPAQYGAMSIADICALLPPAADNAHLYLWTTNAFMDEAHDVVRAWGFEPKTVCTWGKIQADGITPSYRMGYYFRGATEHWIFGVRGRLRTLRRDLPTLFLWPRERHSVKPDAFYNLVQDASPGPYFEMFARAKRLGWDAWGAEVDSGVEWRS